MLACLPAVEEASYSGMMFLEKNYHLHLIEYF